MDYDVKLSDDGTFVWQLPHENMTMALAREMSCAAIQLAATKKINAFLSDVRGIRNVDSLVNNYDFVSLSLPRIGYRVADKIAVVRDPEDHSHDFIQFISTNAGYAVKLFTDVQAAMDWLKTERTPRKE